MFLYLCTLAALVATFLFSVPQTVWAAVSDHTVQGVTPRGTTINLFDYWISSQNASDQANPDGYKNLGINADSVLDFGAGMGNGSPSDTLNATTVNQWTQSAQPRTGIVDAILSNSGYPTLSSGLGGGSLAYLFNSQSFNGKQAYMDVDGLLQVDNNGYYYYSSQKNFAEYDADTNSFILYDKWGVAHAGSSPDGQFFPFNKGSQVLKDDGTPNNNITSTNRIINHYFGMTMSTRFVQQYGGHTDDSQNQDVTYNFSGDDDVWVYIDGVLVGDLGGIHDATSLEINFSTGMVYVYHDEDNDNQYDEGETVYNGNGNGQTLKDIFDEAGVKGVVWNDKTFTDNTYHTLNFFYLERGNTDSNMSLKYNLVNIPESGILKIDQDGGTIEGVGFALYPADDNYIKKGNAYYTGTTDANGELIFTQDVNGNEMPVTLKQLAGISDYWVLVETGVSNGYRNPGEIHLRFENGVLLSSNEWDTGAYSQPHVTATATDTVYEYGNVSEKGGYNASTGTMFAVVLQKQGDGNWAPVSGNAFSGWSIGESIGGDASAVTKSVIDAARANPYQFLLGSGGAYEVDIENLPGDIGTYEYVLANNGGDVSTAKYTVAYYRTTASSISGATPANTVRLQANATNDYVGFDRVFSVTLNISNIKNELSLVKTDAVSGAAIKGAVFALYNDSNNNGTYEADVDGLVVKGLTTDETGTLNVANEDGLLPNGNYVLVETSPADGYMLDTTPIQIVVDDDGVHVNAGTDDDNVSVETGLGTLVYSMKGFAAGDQIDATLHDVQAQPQVSNAYNGSDTQWTIPTEGDPATEVPALHLQYNDDNDKVLNYSPTEGITTTTSYIAAEGWSRLNVTQCLQHVSDENKLVKQELFNDDGTPQSLNSLFTGDVTIHVTNLPQGDYSLTKEMVEGVSSQDGFTFDLSFGIDVPEPAEGEEQVLTAANIRNYLLKDDGEHTAGTYNYTISDSNSTDPVESGTLTIGAVEGTYIITNCTVDDDVEGVGIENVGDEDTPNYVLKLKPGQKFVIEGLPIYTQIVATEQSASGYAVDSVTVDDNIIYPMTSDAQLPDDEQGNDEPINDVSQNTEEMADDPEIVALDAIDPDTGSGADSSLEPDVEAMSASETGVTAEATITLRDDGGYGTDVMFTNTRSVTVNIQVQKTLVGHEWSSDNKSAYGFTLTALDNAPKPSENKIEITSDSTVVDGNSAARQASFGDIVFTQPGTYIYYVAEEPLNDGDGWSFDHHIAIVKVTIDDDFKPEVVYDNDGDEGTSEEGDEIPGSTNESDAKRTDIAAFTNSYSAGGLTLSGETALRATKVVEGADAPSEFSFSLELTSGDASAVTLPSDEGAQAFPAGGVSQSTSTLTGDEPQREETVSFGAVSFSAAGDYTFKVTETTPQPDPAGGWDYASGEEHAQYITVSVRDNGAGQLVADGSVEGSGVTGNNPTFTNSYTATTEPEEGGTPAVIQGLKKVVGTDMSEGEFTFELEQADGKGSYYDAVTNNEKGAFSFTLNYTQDSFTDAATINEDGKRTEEFTYALAEANGGKTIAGISYDSAVYMVMVTLVDNGDGTLVATPTIDRVVVNEDGSQTPEPVEDNTVSFTNTYAGSTTAAFEVDKVLSGRTWADGDEFEFVAYPYGGTVNDAVSTGTTVDGTLMEDGSVSVTMTPVTYTASKMDMNAWVAGENGTRYQTFDYVIEEELGSDLTISYSDAKFYARVTVNDDGQGNLTTSVAYYADEASLANGTPMGEGAVPTFTNTYQPDATTFHVTGTKRTTFTNVSEEPADLRFVYDVYLEDGTEGGTWKASGWSPANGSVSIDIPIEGEGSFTYRIVERYGGSEMGAVTYSGAVYYLDLAVQRDAATGIYNCTPTYYRADGTQISAEDLVFENTYDGSKGLTVSIGDGVKVLDGATFDDLDQLDEPFRFSVTEIAADGSTSSVGEGELVGVRDDGTGIIVFPSLNYSFYLQDQPVEDPAADDAESGDGQEVVDGEGDATVETGGEGSDGADEGDATSGEIEAPVTGGEPDSGTVVPPAGDGNAATGEPNPGAPDEGAGSGEGATAPETSTDDEVSSSDATDGGATTPDISIEPEPEAVTEGVQTASIADLFTVSEAIADDTGAEPFTVDMIDETPADDGQTVVTEPAVDEGADASGGAAVATEPVVVSDDLGRHQYVIAEEIPAGSTANDDGTWTAPNGVTYTGIKYLLTVDVSAWYNAEKGQIETSYTTSLVRSDQNGTFGDAAVPADSILFTNSYTAAKPVAVSFEGAKNLTGRDLAAGEFTFVVSENGKVVDTATNDADGKVSFSFDVTTQGTHTYTVSEVNDGKDGVGYDATWYTVSAEVVVDADGNLVVESVSLPEGGLVFNNTYTVSGATKATITGTKTMTGRDMAEGEFRFVLVDTTDGADNVVTAATNKAAADGEASEFDLTVRYDEGDLGKTFTYEVRELDLGAGGVAYDTTVFPVSVTVRDDGQGGLAADVTYPEGGIAFVNEYGTAEGTSVTVTPEATKTLTGRDMVEGEFTFVATDVATGNVVARGRNAADGAVAFDSIELTAKGDYEFVVTEVNGRQSGVTYDDAAYRMLVTVSDDGEGGLVAEVDYPDGLPRFANSYEEPARPSSPGTTGPGGEPNGQVPKTGDSGAGLAGAAALGLGGLGAVALGGGALLRRRANR